MPGGTAQLDLDVLPFWDERLSNWLLDDDVDSEKFDTINVHNSCGCSALYLRLRARSVGTLHDFL